MYTEKGEERERAFINLYNNIENRLSSSLKGSGALGRPSNALHPSKGDYLVIEAFIQHQRMFIKAQTNTRTGQTVQLHASSITRLYHAKTEEKALSLAHLILIQVHNIIRYKGTGTLQDYIVPGAMGVGAQL